MASNHEDHSRIDPKEHQPDPLKKSMIGSIANRIGTSASGLISSSLFKLDPLSVCSTVNSLGGDGDKAPPTSASSSASASSSYIARTRGLAGDDTWPAPSIPQDHGNETQASHSEQWRHHHHQNKIASEFDDFVSYSKGSQPQPWALSQTNQSGVEYIFHTGLKPGFAASQRDQSQAGVLTDESCRESKAIPSQLSTEGSFTSIRDRPGFGDFTPEWKRLHIQHFGDIQTDQYRQKLGHRTTTDGARPGLRLPKNVVQLPTMIDTRSHIPDDGAEVVFLLSDPEFCPGGESHDQFQYSIDEFSLGDETESTGAMASISSQWRATSEPDPLFGHLESKATPSGVALSGLPSDEKMALNCDYPLFPARYVEEVWSFFTSTKPKRLASGTLPSEAVKKIPQLNGANEKRKPTALNRLAMVLLHLGPNTSKFGAQNQRTASALKPQIG